MSEPAVFVLIRDGQPRFFGDRWASAFLFREIVWGPDELERWLTESEELDAWSDDASGGVVVDFDRKKLLWHGDAEAIGVPRVSRAYNKLLQASWPGYEIEFASGGLADLAAAAGEPDEEEYEDDIPERCETVRESAGMYADEDEEYDEGHEYDEDETRAWITLVDPEGAVRHRHVNEVAEDLIRGRDSALKDLANLPAAEVPPEAVVTEGMWIDQAKQEIGFWGGPMSRIQFSRIKEAWEQLPEGWSVRWADNGYADHCAISGPSGIPMSDAQAMGMIAPTILSTKRLDLQTMFGAMGGALKRTAIKATGCLLLVICAPVLLFGAISGNWQAALITIAIVTACVVIAFKVIESRVKSKFAMPSLAVDEDEEEEQRAPVSGPLDESERRQRLEQMLKAAGLPTLAEIEPHFAADTLDDLLD